MGKTRIVLIVPALSIAKCPPGAARPTFHLDSHKRGGEGETGREKSSGFAGEIFRVCLWTLHNKVPAGSPRRSARGEGLRQALIRSARRSRFSPPRMLGAISRCGARSIATNTKMRPSSSSGELCVEGRHRTVGAAVPTLDWRLWFPVVLRGFGAHTAKRDARSAPWSCGKGSRAGALWGIRSIVTE